MRIGAALLTASTSLAVHADAAPRNRFGPNEGQVLGVDRKGGEIAIRHGYLPELSMDAMSMYFHVANPALFDKVRKGDRVRFRAGMVEGKFAVIEIERVKPAARR